MKFDTSISKDQKKILIGFAIIGILVFFAYRYQASRKDRLLSSNFTLTHCSIHNSRPSKTSYINEVQFSFEGSQFIRPNSGPRCFKGEFYYMKQSNEDLDTFEVYYHLPIIFDTKLYVEEEANLTLVYQKSDYKIVEFDYVIDGEKYHRRIRVKSSANIQENDRIKIYVHKLKSKISYLKDYVDIRET